MKENLDKVENQIFLFGVCVCVYAISLSFQTLQAMKKKRFWIDFLMP